MGLNSPADLALPLALEGKLLANRPAQRAGNQRTPASRPAVDLSRGSQVVDTPAQLPSLARILEVSAGGITGRSTSAEPSFRFNAGSCCLPTDCRSNCLTIYQNSTLSCYLNTINPTRQMLDAVRDDVQFNGEMTEPVLSQRARFSPEVRIRLKTLPQHRRLPS